MSLSLTKGLCILAFLSMSVSSKVRWRNALCFITKPQQRSLHALSAGRTWDLSQVEDSTLHKKKILRKWRKVKNLGEDGS